MKLLRDVLPVLIVALTALPAGCKKEPPPPAPVRREQVQPAPQPQPADPPQPAKADKRPPRRPGTNPLLVPTDYIRLNVDALQNTKKRVGLIQLERSIATFQVQHERYPESLEELAKYHGGGQLPQLPRFYRFSYDPETGTIDVVFDDDDE